MSISVMSRVWEGGPESQGELLVLLALADFANDDGMCWPSLASIASKARVTVRGAQKILRRLEQDGRISATIGGGRGGKNLYRVNTEPRSVNIVRGEPEPPNLSAETPNVVPKTPNGGSPEPSRTVREPSEREKARASRFDEFWSAYPHRNGAKKAKGKAQESYVRALRRGVPEQVIIDGAHAAHQHPDVVRGYARDPTTWLNQSGWADEFAPTVTPFPRRQGNAERLDDHLADLKAALAVRRLE